MLHMLVHMNILLSMVQEKPYINNIYIVMTFLFV